MIGIKAPWVAVQQFPSFNLKFTNPMFYLGNDARFGNKLLVDHSRIFFDFLPQLRKEKG